MKVLVPIDGSQASIRAVDHVVDKRAWYSAPVEVHVLNVQHPLPSDVSRFIPQEEIKGFHHDAGIRALAAARTKLEAGAIDHVFHISVGEPAHVIAHYAKELGCDQIIMGSQGQGVAADAFGSVARRVIHLADVPVVLVK